MVGKSIRRLAWAIVVFLNVFFVYFSAVRALQRGSSWQQGYITACVFQFVVEIFFYETMECFWVHFFIPNLVTPDINTIQFSLHQTIDLMCSDVLNTKYFFDATHYLFVSNQIAQKFPDLLESVLVLSYHYHLPGELGKKWMVKQPHEVLREIQGRKRLFCGGYFNFTLTALLIHGFVIIGSSPGTLQRSIIHCFLPMMITGLVWGFEFLRHHPIYLGVFGLFGIYQVILLANKFRVYYERNNDIILPDARGSYVKSIHGNSSMLSILGRWINGSAENERSTDIFKFEEQIPHKINPMEMFDADNINMSDSSESDEEKDNEHLSGGLSHKDPGSERDESEKDLESSIRLPSTISDKVVKDDNFKCVRVHSPISANTLSVPDDVESGLKRVSHEEESKSNASDKHHQKKTYNVSSLINSLLLSDSDDDDDDHKNVKVTFDISSSSDEEADSSDSKSEND